MSHVTARPLPSYDDRNAVREALRAALEPLGGIGAFVKPDQRVLLKPNFVKAMDPARGAVTHPAIVVAMVELVREAGAREVLVGDSPAFGSAANASAKIGLTGPLEEAGARIVEFREVRRVRHGLENGRFKALSHSGEVLDADVLINLPKAKAHCQMVMTGAVKNLFGCIPGRKKALMHCLVDNSRLLFGRMLVDNARSLNAVLHVMDGVVTMEGMGPTRGTPKHWGWVLASADPVGLDRVVSEAMGYGFDEVPHLQAARAMHYGETDLAKIRLEGATLEELRIADWERAQMMPISFNPIRIVLGYLKHWRAWKPSQA